MSNLLYLNFLGEYPFEWLLALIAFNTWVKFVLKLRITKKFGPVIKVLIVMVGDLV